MRMWTSTESNTGDGDLYTCKVHSGSVVRRKAIQICITMAGDMGDELLGGYQRISNSLLKKSKLQNMLPNLYSLYPPFLGSGANLTKFSNDIAKAYSTYLYDEKFLNYLGIE